MRYEKVRASKMRRTKAWAAIVKIDIKRSADTAVQQRD